MKAILFAVLIAAAPAIPALATDEVKKPLDAPKAAYWHPESRTWLVSSLGG